ncbi:pyruvate dehydrogenase (acetyl-transferring), homodimeric type [Buchananella hordeovulneris]|uniref:Pyruvate dehydrogenase E1 component n=1 Tax=Buchananella hordeovulneris TaxID=52770 RepID=A0A1Q5PX26_9ACTO|nr:pyruvate dehydrogenase (acetyl-transferring), homodimeric type [Buchananella hordeovulneris]MDO5080334.1 pyruvate dehydrogenase (acetyl-transferring), homodimeric type [Buchananella hordeovulneris]OKL52174.1 pyruvate dehydrogenase (acetyl-transferring), homodimeric type [Buchananella hordeovulneris]RRD44887.1 pyruvate dehydrogenase (acetyl-transferring), homodimeric type [Buchananella hordeovulneris]RRD52471.1 pyruvate dehydrogenase (acetyl-transferring), homodimeric type [Buchananella horde
MSLTNGTPPLIDGLLSQVPDVDPEETQEWLDSLDGLIDERGGPRARYVLLSLLREARLRNVAIPASYTTPYVNTIGVHEEPYFPGDERVEETYRGWIRWNAAVMVTRAQRPGLSVGGHISSYASVATLYEVGLNHFFRGKDHPGGGDHVFFQGHASPGNYARAFLEGRLTEEDLDGFRQEVSSEHGMPSYPHPRQMPDFWEFPTVSMGLGPAEAIYQAWVDKYLHMRGIKDTSQQHTWAFLGDGEMDEPESRGMLQLAAQQGLDNLTFVVNCNLQRLDGPVRGNGKIIQELEAFFRGAGWNVIKVIWGRGWDKLLNADKDRALVNLMNETLDGDYQTFKANDGAYVREHFFGRDPRTKALVEHMTDDEIWALKRGGHDYRKIFAAYKAAMEHTGQPTVILAHTVKGYGLGPSFAGRMAAHQMKKLKATDLKEMRDRFQIPISDEELEANPYLPPYYRPADDDPALMYMRERRRALGGFVPERRDNPVEVTLPADKVYDVLKGGSGKQEIATTMAFVRLLKDLIRDKEFGHRIVPIIPDEARTFGLDSIFPSAKIFHTRGMNYVSADHQMMLSYKESQQGQILHTGINEAGSAAAFQVVGTSYATHGQPMVPMYICYSMFGFQRTADQFWAAGDQLTRGFLIGATAGRTTLAGEGTQHMDGHSPLIAGTNSSVIHYDPGYAYEIRHIVRDGLQRMYGPDETRDRNVMYYLTVYNEPYAHPAEPENVDVDGIIRGIYQLAPTPEGEGPQVQLLASGVGVKWIEEAQRLLAADWGVRAGLWSVTSWNELRRDGLAADEFNYLHPEEPQRRAYVTDKLAGAGGPFVATSDYDHLVPDQIRKWVPGDFHTLGADGFGFSDTRAAARRYYKIDAHSVVVKALQALVAQGALPASVVREAMDKYDLLNVNAGTSGSTGGDA